ncbi:MAG: hypothetical protein COV67_09690 [Nitrospinae bacterium CG11_big_fil_rev_8_21_14_0_20_56_8]|nr:MAG: hypothetical protein COV67_09690 [Nitrospinae bacterium CG11_big_fil_rev_8_21_14_0_20_56_8]
MFFSLLLGVLFLGVPQSLPAQQDESRVEASGMGNTDDVALKDAMRNAVEQFLGVLVDSKTMAENFQIVSDKILTASQGYVTDYEIISQSRDADGMVNMRIKARVQKTAVLDDVRSLKIFQSTKLDNKRLMVIYSQDTEGPPESDPSVSSAQTAANDFFLKKRFRVFDETVVREINQELSQYQTDPEARLIQLAKGRGAELLIKFNLSYYIKPGDPFYIAYSRMQSKLFDPTTGRLLATSENRSKQVFSQNTTVAGAEDAVAKASAKVAQDNSQSLLENIVDFFSVTGAKEFFLVFQDFPEGDLEKISSTIQNGGFPQFRELSLQAGTLELEIFDDAQTISDLRKKVKQILRGTGVELETLESSGNRLIFKRAKS